LTDSLLRALGWVEYLESHAKRAYASVSRADFASARELLRRIQAGELPDHFRARDIYIKGWSRLATPEQAHRAVFATPGEISRFIKESCE
jgi:hypothetical protein